MTDDEFAEIIRLSHEYRGIEFKGPLPLTDKHFMAKVIRGMLGMANRRDGGYVVIGVNDDNGILTPVGLEPGILETWKYDDVASAIAPYTTPVLSFDIEVHEYKEQFFVVIIVAEFEDAPILCARDYPSPNKETPPVLRKGACYVRSKHKPETSEIPTQEDMRALLDLAIEKGVKHFIVRNQAVGLALTPASNIVSSAGLFNKQGSDLK